MKNQAVVIPHFANDIKHHFLHGQSGWEIVSVKYGDDFHDDSELGLVFKHEKTHEEKILWFTGIPSLYHIEEVMPENHSVKIVVDNK